MPSKLAVIGGGRMGEALARRMTSRALDNPLDTLAVVSEPLEARRNELKEIFKGESDFVQITDSSAEAVEGARIVLLAFKPQQFAQAAAELRPLLKQEQLVASIMAGTTIAALREGLEHRNIVRAMPNIAVQDGMGFTAWHAAEEADSESVEEFQTLLRATGLEMEADSEERLDAVTAVSGSGPAYLFLFMEALRDAAAELGIDPAHAAAMVASTVRGAAGMAFHDADYEGLRRKVTSPGGTTEAAVKVLEASGFRDLIADAVRAAHRRSQQLGGN